MRRHTTFALAFILLMGVAGCGTTKHVALTCVNPPTGPYSEEVRTATGKLEPGQEREYCTPTPENVRHQEEHPPPPKPEPMESQSEKEKGAEATTGLPYKDICRTNGDCPEGVERREAERREAQK